jgi:hypothetical protein
MVGPATHQRVADRPVRVELVALPDHRQVQPARAGDGPGVGLLVTGDQAQQSRLAVAVAADDADAIARRDAERHTAQHGPAAVALVDRLQVDEVARGSRHQRAVRRAGARRRT